MDGPIPTLKSPNQDSFTLETNNHMYSNPGQPFNQLAALSGSQCYGIIAVYYYLRCLTSEQKFEGAEGNLKKILDKAASTGSNSVNAGK